MQWIAMLTMLIDHIGVVFYPDNIVFRLIGRIAFPLYVYLAVLGYQRTSNINRYILRLVLLALVSQIPFQLAFDTTSLNVIGTLAISVVTIKCIDSFSRKPFLYIPITLIALVILDLFAFDYGAYGLLLMLVYRYLMSKPKYILVVHVALEAFFFFFYNWGIQMLTLFVTIFLVYNPAYVSKLDSIRSPKWLWRLFYPLHLIILYIIVKYLLVN